MTQSTTIRIAAALITDQHGHALLVRKRNSAYFMQPGGKPETGETPAQALIRELQEELNITLDEQNLIPLGTFTDRAINEPGCELIAEVFRVSFTQRELTPAAEIEEVIWLDPALAATVTLAPLTRDQLLPLLS